MWQTKPEREQKEETEQSRWGFRGMTVRAWLELLIVPMVLVGIGLLFEMQQAERQRATEQQQQALADQRSQDEALQAYLNQMSDLLLERNLLEAEQGDPVHTLAQARTSTVILRLDAEHNESVTRFLGDSGLAGSDEASVSLLRKITLSHATLSDTFLPNADLNGAYLSGADLRKADLRKADLSEETKKITLSGTDVSHVYPVEADLSGADLSGASLRFAYLSGANLQDADLSGVDLYFADLDDADLSKANLRGAKALTDHKIASAESFEGATMPNGQNHEDWLKSKNREEGGKNDGSS